MKSKIVNVLDIEVSCYKDCVFPDGQRPEIIEFGLCPVDIKARKILKSVSIPIIPTMSDISPFCTELTGWTKAKLLRQGIAFDAACARLTNDKYGGRGRVLVVDSCGDPDFIRQQCALKSVAYPFGNDVFNVSTWFQMIGGQTDNIGLDAMLDRLGLRFEGTRHRASCDAYNIARLYLALLDRCSLPALE